MFENLKKRVYLERYSVGEKMTKNQSGFSLFELMVALTVLTLIIGVVTPSYFGFRKGIERRLHIVNAINLRNVAQNGILEGWVQKPSLGQVTNITLEEMIDNNEYAIVIDPSSSKKSYYKETSFVQIFNNDRSFEYYIHLESRDLEHIYMDTTNALTGQGTKEIHLMDTDDIQLRN